MQASFVERYIFVLLACAVSGLAAIFSLNFWEDSRGFLRALGWKSAGSISSDDRYLAAFGRFPVPHGEREAKLLNVRWYWPQIVVLGSSNVWSHFDVIKIKQPDGRAAFNFGLAGASATEIEEAVNHIIALNPPKRIILGLEFFAFNANREFQNPLLDFPLAHQDNYTVATTRRVIAYLLSMDSIFQKISGHAMRLINFKRAEPQPVAAQPAGAADARLRRLLAEMDSIQMKYLYNAKKPFAFGSSLESLRRFLQKALAANIEVQVFLSPHHVRTYEILRAIGFWPYYISWLQEIASISDQVNSGRSCADRIPFLDFGAYKPENIDMNFVSEGGGIFKDYVDSFHYRTHVGDRIIATLSGYDGCRDGPGGFATDLSNKTIAAHLARIEEARSAFAAQYPETIAEVAALARRYP